MKRIKKVKQIGTVVPNNADILNEHSTSTKDIYACDYINNITDYSTTETVCGTWINGKPLYRIVLTGTLGASGSNAYTYENVLPETVVIRKTSGTVYGFSRNDTRPMLTYLKINNNEYFINYLFNSNTSTNNYNLLLFYSTDYSGNNFELVVEYTKTTD